MARGKKTGGRIKGTPNVVTRELRSILKQLLVNELENIDILLSNLEPRDRLEILIKLMPFVLPKVKEVFHNIDEPKDYSVETW